MAISISDREADSPLMSPLEARLARLALLPLTDVVFFWAARFFFASLTLRVGGAELVGRDGLIGARVMGPASAPAAGRRSQPRYAGTCVSRTRGCAARRARALPAITAGLTC